MQTFFHPALRYSRRYPVYPIFIPFAGCPQRCIFCAQHIQTGQSETVLDQVLEAAFHDILACYKTKQTVFELAFFGGTFTGLADAALQQCCAFLARLRQAGAVAHARCSTRPDYITADIITLLQNAGITTVELGIQSFLDEPLFQSSRGYTGAIALEACQHIKAAGLELGVQLMPGMPGHRPEMLSADITSAIDVQADFVRLYPCLVLQGTPLLQLWREGRFSPWDEETVVQELARASLRLWEQHIPIARMGVAPQEGLLEQIAAGVWHPALGMRVRALALFLYIEALLMAAPRSADDTAFVLMVPQCYSGEFWGHAKELAGRYASLGITKRNVVFWAEAYFAFAPQNIVDDV